MIRMMMRIILFITLGIGLEGLRTSSSQHHVTYQVNQLYQACPSKGQIIVNGSSDQSFDIETLGPELKRQGVHIEWLESALDRLQGRVAALENECKDKEAKPCDVRDIRRPDGTHPKDCTEIYSLGGRAHGAYTIKPRGAPQPFRVLCELTLEGGWTVLMRRFNGSVDFYRKWVDYKRGFGSLNGEHWLGNDKIHWLTSQQNYKMQVDMRYWASKISYYAIYNRFSIDNEAAKYKLNIHGYSGNVGYDGMTQHDGIPFSTWHRDNDIDDTRHCAQNHKGAFWYTNCHYGSVPTGMYKASCVAHDCVEWKYKHALDKILMKVKHD